MRVGTLAAQPTGMNDFNHMAAPATRLVATYCCCCHLPLVDADSVQLGIGPVCRKKHSKVETSPVWEKVADELALFAAADKSDEDRHQFFEHALLALDGAKRALDGRTLCNLLTHWIAAVQHRRDRKIGHLLAAIEHTGRPRLAKAIGKNLYTVRIELMDDGTRYRVYSPYNETFRGLVWTRQLGKWSKEDKCYIVPVHCKDGLSEALDASYPGTWAMGPKGEFLLGGES